MNQPNINPNEKAASIIGGKAGGAYLDKIGVFDLRQLTADQWSEFCGRIFLGSCAELARVADDEIPF